MFQVRVSATRFERPTGRMIGARVLLSLSRNSKPATLNSKVHYAYTDLDNENTTIKVQAMIGSKLTKPTKPH